MPEPKQKALLRVPKAEFKGDAPEDERQQHDQNGKINRRDDDGESQRKGGHEPDAAKNQPGLVAVPDRRDRVHDRVARGCIGREAEQHADSQIEAVEQDIEEYRHPEEQRPYRHEIEDLAHLLSPSSSSAPARTGVRARPGLIFEASAEDSSPLRTMRTISRSPDG